MRRVLAAASLAGALVLAGCGASGDADPAEPAEAPESDQMLATKLGALRADACHASPQEQEPRSCERYVTQVQNTANSLERAAAEGDQRFASAAEVMGTQASAYWDNGCATENPSSVGGCTSALSELAEVVDALHQDVSG